MNEQMKDSIDTSGDISKKGSELLKPIISIRTKISLSLVAVMLVTLIVSVFYVAYLHLQIQIVENIIRNLMIGNIVAVNSDQDELTHIYEEGQRIYDSIPEDIKEKENSPEYLVYFDELETDPVYIRIKDKLRESALGSGVNWVDMYIFDDARDRVIYLIKTDVNENVDYDAGYCDPGDVLVNNYSDSSYVENRLPETGEAVSGEDESEEKLYSPIWDQFYQTLLNLSEIDVFGINEFTTSRYFYHPETGQMIGVIGTGDDISDKMGEVQAFRFLYLLIMIVYIIIILLLYRFVINRWLVGPIRKLSKSARDYVDNRGDIQPGHYFEQVEIKTRDEVRVLRDSMSDMEVSLAEYMDNMTSMTAERERVEAELNLGASIQLSMLPKKLENYNGEPVFDISSFIEPAKEVGGDFYDYYVIDDDHIGITIADVSGKGVPAALFMVVVKTLLKTIGQDSLSPADIVSRVNARLCENNEELMFVTLLHGIYCISDRSFVFVNGGHDDPALYRAADGRFGFVSTEHDIALGIDDTATFNEHRITLEPGDRLFMYTDGLPEANNEAGEMFDFDRMQTVLSANLQHTGRDFLDGMTGNLKEFTKAADQFDDITMVLLEIK